MSLTPTFPNWMTGDRDREDAAVLAGAGDGAGSPRGGELAATATAATAALAVGTAEKDLSPFDVAPPDSTAGGGAAEPAGVVVPCAVVTAAVGTLAAAAAAGGAGFMRSLTEATGAEGVGDGEACWAAGGAPAVAESAFPPRPVSLSLSCSHRRSWSAFFDLAAVSLAAFAFAFTAARLCSHTRTRQNAVESRKVW